MMTMAIVEGHSCPSQFSPQYISYNIQASQPFQARRVQTAFDIASAVRQSPLWPAHCHSPAVRRCGGLARFAHYHFPNWDQPSISSEPIIPREYRSLAKAMLLPSGIVHIPYLTARFCITIIAVGFSMPQLTPRQWMLSYSNAYSTSPAYGPSGIWKTSLQNDGEVLQAVQLIWYFTQAQCLFFRVLPRQQGFLRYYGSPENMLSSCGAYPPTLSKRGPYPGSQSGGFIKQYPSILTTPTNKCTQYLPADRFPKYIAWAQINPKTAIKLTIHFINACGNRFLCKAYRAECKDS